MAHNDLNKSEQEVNMGQLRASDNVYQKMVEEIQDYAIILLDKDGIIMNWNKGAEKIKQYKEYEVVGKHFSIFYLQEDIDDHLPQKLLNEAYEAGRSAQEGWRKRKDNTKFWGTITITALHDDNNEVIGYSKVTRDLTDKKASDDKLRMSEERYHQMIAEVEDYAIILLSVDGVIENWNLGAQKIKGYETKEIIGRKFEVFYTEEDRKTGLPGKLLNIAKEAGKATHEGWRVRKDGTKFWGLIVITALHNKEGNIIGFSKVTRDLTQKKLSDDKLVAYLAELEIQNSELEQFAYVASHDLQEPLRKIQTFADLIRENYDDRTFAIKYIEKLERSAKRMSELVKSLLLYSRLSKEKDNIISDVDLNSIITDIKEDFELLISEKNATIVCETLPVITGNHIQLGQLFANLIGNALKFSHADPVIKIGSTTVERKDIHDASSILTAERYVLITVEDNGIGFEDQYKKSIFSLFKRLHVRQSYAGTGIGLALCKKIAENHKGHISAEGDLGKGAIFSVYLPLS
jgi:PAS domain S-box-containing protein